MRLVAKATNLVEVIVEVAGWATTINTALTNIKIPDNKPSLLIDELGKTIILASAF